MTTFVLIPGASGESHYWPLVAAPLRASGDDATSPDLPADDDAAPLCDHIDVAVAAARGARDAVVVAQSLGTFIAAQLAERIGRAARRPRLPDDPGPPRARRRPVAGQRHGRRAANERAGRDPDRPFDEAELFLHDVRPEALPARATRV